MNNDDEVQQSFSNSNSLDWTSTTPFKNQDDQTDRIQIQFKILLVFSPRFLSQKLIHDRQITRNEKQHFDTLKKKECSKALFATFFVLFKRHLNRFVCRRRCHHHLLSRVKL